eukprot:352248-Chlamydomonas_euryale.AAC.1
MAPENLFIPSPPKRRACATLRPPKCVQADQGRLKTGPENALTIVSPKMRAGWPRPPQGSQKTRLRVRPP